MSTYQSSVSGPLAGLKVLECTHALAGAWCGILLADLGADVVKIEATTGETTRSPYEAYATGSDPIVVGCGNNRLWQRFCDGIERPELANDPRFATPTARHANRQQLEREIETILAAQPATYWLSRLEAVGVPAGPVNDIAQAHNDPLVKSLEMVVEVEGERYMRTPISLSDAEVSIRRGPPALGEHTREVLAETGFSAAEVAKLLDDGILVQA
jgi:formyl-CoA transferase